MSAINRNTKERRRKNQFKVNFRGVDDGCAIELFHNPQQKFVYFMDNRDVRFVD